MAIVKLKPFLKPYLWGGEKLKENYHAVSDDIVAEMWVVSCHPDGESIVESGEYKGKTLSQYIEFKGKEVLGRHGSTFDKFPILIKLLDANKDLSIQVHPDDEYGLRVEKEFGKNEMWLVLESEPGSSIYYGVKDSITKEEYKQSILNSTLLEKLNEVETNPYDFFYVPAGTIHALNKGNVIAEIQQSSNSTYRIFDYNRIDKDGKLRELHIDKAVDVSYLNPIQKEDSLDFSKNKEVLIDNQFFKTTFYRINEITEIQSSIKSFHGLVVIKGSGIISDGHNEYKLDQGNGVFIDANTKYELDGNMEILVSEV